MIQKMHPQGVILGAFFPPQLEFEKRKSAYLDSILSIYTVVLVLGESWKVLRPKKNWKN